ncbi:MAG: ATP-binding protein [Actinobacteria bacterium]|nr:ATP-binding protein [Actinomycetota bacterium]
MIGSAEILSLPPRLEAATQARRHVRQQLVAWELDDLVDPVVLLTSEVVTNALLHAGTVITVAVRRDGQGVRVEVGDGSGAQPVQRRRSTTATTGRGVQLLESVSDGWGSTAVGEGKLVWFRVVSAQTWASSFSVDGWAGAGL